jgi:tetratricopeptide (TPR) repeat protein
MQRNNKIRLSGICLLILIGLFLVPVNSNSQNKEIDSIIELGDDMLSLNDYDAAMEKYEKALEMNDSYPPAIEAKIQTLVLMEKFNKAGKLVDQALSNNPYYTPFYLYKGKIEIEKERFDEAKISLNKALDIADDPDQKTLNKIYVNLGAAYQKTGNFEKALEFYSKSLNINKQNPNVFIYRGYLYFKKEKYEEAIEDFKKVIDLDPNNHYAQYNIGMSHYKMGNKYDAKDAFHKACELGNKNACKMLITKFINTDN